MTEPALLDTVTVEPLRLPPPVIDRSPLFWIVSAPAAASAPELATEAAFSVSELPALVATVAPPLTVIDRVPVAAALVVRTTGAP